MRYSVYVGLHVPGKKPIFRHICNNDCKRQWWASWNWTVLTEWIVINFHICQCSDFVKMYKSNWRFAWEPTYSYDLLPLLVFIIETDFVLCEVWAEAEETVEHWVSTWAPLNNEYPTFKRHGLQILPLTVV